MLIPFGSDVVDSVDHDVVDVIVGDGVHDLAAAPLSQEQIAAAEYPQMLGHERLACTGRLDELVNALRTIDEGGEQGEAQRMGHRLQELGAAHVRLIGVLGCQRCRHSDIVTLLYDDVNM